MEFKDKLAEDYIDLYGSPDFDVLRQYSFVFLYKADFKENDIFMVQISEGGLTHRLGWVFPLIALGSKEHDRWGCPHFEVYARVGGGIITGACGEVVDENTHLLILKDDRALAVDLYVENLVVSLMRYGYYSVSSSTLFKNGLCSVAGIDNNKLAVKKALAVDEYVPYVRRLILELLPKVLDPLSRFLSIYQVYELLMERYFHVLMEEYRVRRTTIGTIREKMNDLSSERKLIGGVFSRCEIRQATAEDERSLLRRLFGDDRDEQYYSKLTLQDFIYDLRNAIVHNYHKYELSSLMSEISERMELILIEVLENPKVSSFLREASAR